MSDLILNKNEPCPKCESTSYTIVAVSGKEGKKCNGCGMTWQIR